MSDAFSLFIALVIVAGICALSELGHRWYERRHPEWQSRDEN